MFAFIRAKKGRDRRRTPRTPLNTEGHLVACPASSKTAPMKVRVADCSATGVGIVHTEPLPLGQKYVVKERTVSRRNSVLFTVVRSDRIDHEKFSIGLHASHLLAHQFDHAKSEDEGRHTFPAMMLIIAIAAGVLASILFL